MKMSKSIKDYREAMDSIKISDSFYKRTETLLTELPEIKIEKKPAFTARRATAVLSVAAACLLLAFGFRFVIEKETESKEIITEVTSIAEDPEITLTQTASPVVESITEDDYSGGVGYKSSSETEADADADAGAVTSVPESAEASVHSSQTTQTSQKPVSETAADAPSTGNVHSGGEGKTTDSAEDATVSEPLFSEISYEHVTVEITPYFDMGTIKSGENPVKLKGTDCKEIIEFIKGIAESSNEISNYSFTSVFSMQISDENLGLTFYSIYVTDLDSIVITRHGTNGQVRDTYSVNASDYEALMHILFLQFGSEKDYELFTNLISGK